MGGVLILFGAVSVTEGASGTLMDTGVFWAEGGFGVLVGVLFWVVGGLGVLTGVLAGLLVDLLLRVVKSPAGVRGALLDLVLT